MPKTDTAGGDVAAFEDIFQRHRRELHVHCYRMTGSLVEAEDLVQETFVRAWRGLDGFEGRASLRAWLYRIATNACLDALEHSGRSAIPAGAAADVLAESRAVQPYPDALLYQTGASEASPDSAAIARETIELAFIAASSTCRRDSGRSSSSATLWG